MVTVASIAGQRSAPEVVVYGATGYTGQLTCEALGSLGVAFTAAGRNQAKLDEQVQRYRAQGWACEARAAQHNAQDLRTLLTGAKVVVNNSGPFLLLGEAVVEAALACGCHYVDSTGEQEFMLNLRRNYGDRFRAKGLVLSPSVSFLFVPGCLGADLCLESAGIHSIEVAYAPPSLQTMASLQSMWRTNIRDDYSLVRRRLFKLPAAAMSKKTLSDGVTRKALRIGTSEATFLLDDPRALNCEVYFASDTLARVMPLFRFWKFLNRFVSTGTLDRWSDAIVERLKRNPPPEEPHSSRFVVDVTGRGAGGTVDVVINGTSPYVFTGFVGAVAAQTLLTSKPLATGYVSLGKALGTDYVIKRLEEIGTIVTVTRDSTASPVGRSAVSARRA